MEDPLDYSMIQLGRAIKQFLDDSPDSQDDIKLPCRMVEDRAMVTMKGIDSSWDVCSTQHEE